MTGSSVATLAFFAMLLAIAYVVLQVLSTASGQIEQLARVL